jgi:hypothetical protein
LRTTILKKTNILYAEQKPHTYVHELDSMYRQKKVNKGAWRMPWVLEAMKDVISCDKPGGLANTI